jgi:mitogen-activated protein kinase 1/3
MIVMDHTQQSVRSSSHPCHAHTDTHSSLQEQPSLCTPNTTLSPNTDDMDSDQHSRYINGKLNTNGKNIGEHDSAYVDDDDHTNHNSTERTNTFLDDDLNELHADQLHTERFWTFAELHARELQERSKYETLLPLPEAVTFTSEVKQTQQIVDNDTANDQLYNNTHNSSYPSQTSSSTTVPRTTAFRADNIRSPHLTMNQSDQSQSNNTNHDNNGVIHYASPVVKDATPHAGLDDVSESENESAQSSPEIYSDNASSQIPPSMDDSSRIRPTDLHGRYDLLRYVGSGSYGHVHIAEDRITKEKVAIKKMVHIFDNTTNAKRLLREIKILRMLKHANVIRFRGILPPSNPHNFSDLLIVFDFVETDLQKLIHSDQAFTIEHVQYFLYQLLCGVKYIHSANIIHRDLKPANILINSDCSLKICDFGLARTTDSYDRTNSSPDNLKSGDTNNSPLSTPNSNGSSPSTPSKPLQAPNTLTREYTKHVVTRWYRAPELILLSQNYSTAIDMWSVGCILAELLSMHIQRNFKNRQPLFPGQTCFPFSAEKPDAYRDQLDQLNVIFHVLGTPTPEEIEKMETDKAKNYLRNLPTKKPIDLRAKFAGVDERAIDLLKKLLCFVPSERWTAEQALAHPFLTDMRNEADEKNFDLTVGDWFFEDKQLNRDQIKTLIIDEILKDNKHMNLSMFMPAPPLKSVLKQTSSSNPVPPPLTKAVNGVNQSRSNKRKDSGFSHDSNSTSTKKSRT